MQCIPKDQTITTKTIVKISIITRITIAITKIIIAINSITIITIEIIVRMRD